MIKPENYLSNVSRVEITEEMLREDPELYHLFVGLMLALHEKEAADRYKDQLKRVVVQINLAVDVVPDHPDYPSDTSIEESLRDMVRVQMMRGNGMMVDALLEGETFRVHEIVDGQEELTTTVSLQDIVHDNDDQVAYFQQLLSEHLEEKGLLPEPPAPLVA